MPVFTANIPGILKIGDRIEIGGKIKENARKMSVNLCAQEGEEPLDVVLHFDVRFHRDNIISLSRKSGIWIGSGNLDTNYNMFVPGTIFRIVFEVKDTDVITIYCQGKFHSNFLPKIPLTMAKFLVAWADVERVTHCYFHMRELGLGDDQENTRPQSPRLGVSPATGADLKRCARGPKQTFQGSASNDSSDDDDDLKAQEDHNRSYFYETLMCQQPQKQFGSPQSLKSRKADNIERGKTEYRKYRDTDSEKIESDVSENASRNIDTSVAETDVLPELKRRVRRGKFAPFAHVVNFMEKTRKRN